LAVNYDPDPVNDPDTYYLGHFARASSSSNNVVAWSDVCPI